MFLLAGGLGLIIPAVVLTLNAVRYTPSENASEDHAPTNAPPANPGTPRARASSRRPPPSPAAAPPRRRRPRRPRRLPPAPATRPPRRRRRAPALSLLDVNGGGDAPRRSRAGGSADVLGERAPAVRRRAADRSADAAGQDHVLSAARPSRGSARRRPAARRACAGARASSVRARVFAMRRSVCDAMARVARGRRFPPGRARGYALALERARRRL